MLDKQKLISETALLLKSSNGQLDYSDIGEALKGRASSPSIQAVMFLAMSVICHNIPYYVNNERHVRNLDECFRDAITFYNSNKAELEIVFKSTYGEHIDFLTNFKLPKLTFGDSSHYIFKSGSGTSRPDLVDEFGNTFEVKRNYRGGSRSSLHKADYLIDCLNTTIEIRKIANGTVDLDHYPIARFNGVLSEKISTPITDIDNKIMLALWSGELIESVEELLAEEGFKWNY
jgi:hypothetical protein